MAKQFEQVKRMLEKIERLQQRARHARDDRVAAKYLRQADSILASVQAVKNNWKRFGESARGNTNFKGMRHSPEARAKMSSARSYFWKSKAGFEKMWRARKRRQYREKGKCLFRFPRLPRSVDRVWLKTYRYRYERIIGERPKMRLY
jgi:hypothetical protein